MPGTFWLRFASSTLLSADQTARLRGLTAFSCSVVTVKGEAERLAPIGKSILAESKTHAVALYLIHLDAAVSPQKATITYQISPTEFRNDLIKKVSCVRQ